MPKRADLSCNVTTVDCGIYEEAVTRLLIFLEMASILRRRTLQEIDLCGMHCGMHYGKQRGLLSGNQCGG